MIATCPNEQRLREFSLGRLNEEQSDQVFTHLSDCHDCQELLASGDVNDTLTGQLRDTLAVDNSYRNETECRISLKRALAVLSDVEFSDTSAQQPGESQEQQLPKQIGDYRVLRMIGHGGMGNVFLAEHTKLGQQVALKIIASHRAADPSMRGRFESELRALGKLDHPNIVQAKDAREEDGVIVLVTEFIDGLDLGEIIRRQGPLSTADAAKVAEQVCKALEAIDQANLVHRDIKPSNIMINRQGEVKLLDLGLARLQGDGANREFTMTGQAIGTVDYLAPEQITGTDHVDIRADIYGLGCTLFKLLTGNVPFGGPDHETTFAKMTAHVSAERPSIEIDGGSNELAVLARRMMSVKPDERPADPGSVAVSLKKSTTGAQLQRLVECSLLVDPVSAVPAKKKTKSQATQPTALPWWKRRIPVAAAIAAGLGGLVFGCLLGVVITIKKPDGTTAQIEVPDGSHVEIDDQGNATVVLPEAKPPLALAEGNARSSSDRNSESIDDLGIAPIHRLHGIWVGKIVREVDGFKSADEHGFILAISNGRFAFVHDDEIQDGRIRSVGSSGSLKLEFNFEQYLEPTAVGTRAFPDTFEVVPEFLEGNRVHLNYVFPSESEVEEDTKVYFRLGLAISGRAIIDYPTEKDSAVFQNQPDRLKAWGWAYQQLTGQSTEAGSSPNRSTLEDEAGDFSSSDRSK